MDAGPPDSDAAPSDLHCPACGREYAAAPDEPWRCECGHPLEITARPVRGGGPGESGGGPPAPGDDPPEPNALDRDRGLWAFEALLPVERRVSLGEGWTPLVDAADWDASFKLEYVFPTGSFKDRGATTTLSRAAGLGVDHVLEDSSGNAGAAIATYAARAGIDARIFVPADAKQAKLAAIERTGAVVERVEGTRQDVTVACIEAADGTAPSAGEASRDRSSCERSERSEREHETASQSRSPRGSGEGWYASHAWDPAFLAGTATFAMEVCAQRDWTSPDAVVCPLGHGTLLLGAYRGFRALADAGWIGAVPRLLGVQAAGVAPIVEAVHGPDAADGDANDVADGIQIAAPVRREEILTAVNETDGDVVAVGADATRAALRRLHEAGFYVEPTSAVAPAALERYRDSGVLDAGADVVVPLTGSGLKYEP